MKKKMLIFLLSAIVLAEIICIAGMCIGKGQEENQTEITIRDTPSKTVLYTIYRGSYYKISYAINELYALAKEKGMFPCGPVSTCYLNSPLSVTKDHSLIEIQIPVDSLALEHTGTLGTMTDVKILPAMKVAVAVKPEGIYDTTAIITSLFSWINKNGYVVMGKLQQNILNSDKGNYSNSCTEFMIPIEKLPNDNRLTLSLDPCYM